MGMGGYTTREVLKLYEESQSIRTTLMKMGMAPRGGNYKTIRRILSGETPKLERKGINGSTGPIPFEEILVKGSDYRNTTHLKKRLIKEGVLESKCSECQCGGEWRGKNLVLVLDHVNGDNRDNRLENLRLLCPNCNSQQETFAGRNKIKNPYSPKIYKCRECGTELESRRELCSDCREVENKRRIIEAESRRSMSQRFCSECGSKICSANKTSLCWRCYQEKSRENKEKANIDSNVEIQKLIHQGWSKTSIAGKMGVSSKTIEKRAKEMGLQRGRVSDEEVKEKLVQGLTQKQVADELGVTREVVSYRARKMGLKPRGLQSKVDDCRLKELLDQGSSFQSIADELGFSSTTIRWRADKLGLRRKDI